jgi:hypothetical protein
MIEDGIARRQAEALGNMMAADSRRIDGLVEDVGEVKGDVKGVRSDVIRMAESIDKMQGAMTAFAQHAIRVEHMDDHYKALDLRVNENRADISKLKEVMPGLVEARDWQVLMLKVVIGAVAAAVLGLVIVKGPI